MHLFRHFLMLLCVALGVCNAQAAVTFRSASSAAVYQPTAAYVGASAALSAASGNIAPAVVAERNAVLICIVAQHDNVTISFPAGWTQLYSLSQSSNLRASAYYKVSDDTESAPTIAHAGGDAIIARCYRVRGVDGKNLLDVAYAAQYALSSATVSTGSMTTVTAGDLMLYVAHMARAASTTVVAAPSGTGGVTWTSRAISPTSLGADATVGMYSGVKSTAAATGPISATLSLAGENFGALLALHNGTAMTIALPTGTVANDVMVAAVSVTPASATATAPAGWSLITSTTNGTKLRLTTYYKVASANEPASYTWTLPSTHTGVAGAISSYYGVNTTSPIEISVAQTTLSSASHAAPSVNTTVGNGVLVTVHSYASSIYSASSPYAGAWAPPSGMVEVVDQRSRGISSSNGVALEVNYKNLGAVGATGINTATTPASSSGQRDVGATASIALRATNSLDHLQIDYPQSTLSSCATTPVTITACASTGTTCTSLFTGGVNGIALSPNGGSLSIPAGSASVSGFVSQAAGAATLTASSSGLNATTCKNLSTSSFGCGVTFAPTVVTMSIPNFVSGKSVATTLTACTVPNGVNAVTFYSGYVDPASGTRQVSVAQQTGGVCGNFTSVSATSGSPTSVNLTFASNTAPLCVSYPDVGRVKLVPSVGSATSSAFFTVVPDHFVVSGVSCVSGCKVTPNPAAASASGTAFMKAGSPFLVSVAAYNGASPAAPTPNFGKESTPATVTLTPVLAMPDLPAASVGNLTCSAVSGSCANAVGGTVVLGGFGSTTAGTASSNLLYDEVGIVTLAPALYDAGGLGYMSVGTAALNPVGTTSETIGRFIPDHFSLTKDGMSPILTQTDFLPKVTALATGTSAPGNTIDIDDSSGFVVGAKVRITGGAAGGNAMTAKITALTATTLTLDTAISTDINNGDTVLQEWGTYMGEPFSAQFTLQAQDTNGNQTQNYQGAYAKFDPTASGNPLGFAAVSGGTNLTSRLVISAAATGSFTANGASVVASLSINKAASADGPYTALTLGVAPVDSDGVAMAAYDMSVGGSTNHSSIMDPGVQASTELRYGRSRISNAYGSELLALQVPIAIQYWNGTSYAGASDDAATTLNASDISLSASLGSLTGATGSSPTGTCQPTPLPSAITLTNAAGKFCLTKPGVSGRVTLGISAPGYLGGNTALATFGVYKSPLLYRRENY